jgi:hypothetical protein
LSLHGQSLGAAFAGGAEIGLGEAFEDLTSGKAKIFSAFEEVVRAGATPRTLRLPMHEA